MECFYSLYLIIASLGLQEGEETKMNWKFWVGLLVWFESTLLWIAINLSTDLLFLKAFNTGVYLLAAFIAGAFIADGTK